MLPWKRQGTWNAGFDYYSIILFCGFFCVRLFALKGICEFMPWETHPPAGLTYPKWSASQRCAEIEAGASVKVGKGAKRAQGCPWRSESNIRTGRNVWNSKAVESLGRTIGRCTAEPAAGLQAGPAGWAPKGRSLGAIAWVPLLPGWLGAAAGRPEEQALALPRPLLPSQAGPRQHRRGWRVGWPKQNVWVAQVWQQGSSYAQIGEKLPINTHGSPRRQEVLSAQSSFERGGCTEIEGWRGSALTPPSGFTQQKQHLWKRSACASKEKSSQSAVVFVARMTSHESNGFVCDFFSSSSWCWYFTVLYFTVFFDRCWAVPLSLKEFQSHCADCPEHSWVMELAQTCKRLRPCLAARGRVSGFYTRPRSHSSVSLNCSFLPYSLLEV